MSTSQDMSTLYLSLQEKIALKYIKFHSKLHINDIENHKHYNSLYKKHLIINIPTINGRPRPTDFYKISDFGKDYINYKNECRFEQLFVPVIVTILTNIAIDVLPKLLKLIQELL